MVERFLTSLSRLPRLWNVLRWLAEAGYYRHYQVIDQVLDPGRPDRRRFLDFGCGTGQFAGRFPSRRYVGFDPAPPEYIEYAACRRRGSFGLMDGAALGFRPNSFGGILVLGVFHHLPDLTVERCLAELARVLEPGGTLLVIEDIPPPTALNVPGRVMHWLDRGGHIRSDPHYRRLFEPYYEVRERFTMRSGICDYGVYVLGHRAPQGER
jgi:SAM-dependent methyltransferase